MSAYYSVGLYESARPKRNGQYGLWACWKILDGPYPSEEQCARATGHRAEGDECIIEHQTMRLVAAYAVPGIRLRLYGLHPAGPTTQADAYALEGRE